MAGVTLSAGGLPLLLQDSQAAYNNYGLGSLQLQASPRSKFLFYVNFARIGTSSTTPNALSPVISSTLTGSQNPSTNIGFVVKSIDRPQVTFETEVVNQYNKKRVIQKRVEYGPVSIKFQDTVDDKVLKLFLQYFRHYYGDSQIRQNSAWYNDVVSGNFSSPAGGWGLIANNLSATMRDYFSQLEIYSLFGGNYSQYNLMNPKISTFTPDEYDYSAGGINNEMVMRIAFEGINYIIDSQPLSSNPALLQLMGLDNTHFYEDETGPLISSSPISAITSDLTDSSSFNVNSILNGVNGLTNSSTSTVPTTSGTTDLSVNGLSGNLNQNFYPAGSSQANALDAAGFTSNPNNPITVNGVTYGPAYNPYNTGTSNSTPTASSVPALRGLTTTTSSDPATATPNYVHGY